MSIAQINGVEITIYGYRYDGDRLMVEAITPLVAKVLTYPAELVDVMIKEEN